MNVKLYILGTNTDDKGKQLEELTTTILQKQGYINISTNAVYSGGNEIDAIAVHKNMLGVNEINYPIICECKAHSNPINMTDWLKFIGKIYIERLSNQHTIGLMIALSGANGNVIGSYQDLQKYSFVHLIANDDLVSLLMSEYKLSNPKDIATYTYQYTNKNVAEIGLVYYDKSLYWIINFIDGGFTLLNEKGETLMKESLDKILKLIYSNTSFTGYVDIEAEFKAIIRLSTIDKIALSFLMDELNGLSLSELLKHTQDVINYTIDDSELSTILAKNKFIRNIDNSYSLLPINEIDLIEFYSYILNEAMPIRILSRKLYSKMIDAQLLEKICKIQNSINIPDIKKDDCLFLLRYSPTALSYAIKEDLAITRNRSQNGNTISPNIDKGHTEWFMHKIINSFINDYNNQSLNELYLNDYEIQSICIGLNLTISQGHNNKIEIKDYKELFLSRMSEEYNNKVVLLVKLPE